MISYFNLKSTPTNFPFWKNKKVLITGHTGFKGAWLSIWLQMLGAEVCGYSLPPPTQPNLYECANIFTRFSSIMGDVGNLATLQEVILTFKPDIIFHLAAQSLVRPSYEDPVSTYQSNVMGTVCTLEAARHSPNTKVIQVITSDKCYQNPENGLPLTENTPFGGKDPYSSSKGCAELVTQAYRHSFFNHPESASVSTVRAGNVIGGGDWAIDRLIPDCLRQLETDQPLCLRHPNAIRPWQFVLEPLSGYLWLAQKQWEEPKLYNEGFNFGPFSDNAISVSALAQKFYIAYGAGTVSQNTVKTELHEATLLQLDISKAALRLDWHPVYTVDHTIDVTAEWYKNYSLLSPDELYRYCQKVILDYINTAKQKQITWALHHPNLNYS